MRVPLCGSVELLCAFLTRGLPLALPGVGILLPLALVVCYITRQSQYTNNNILQQTLQAFAYFTDQKNSLATRLVLCSCRASPSMRR